MAVTVTPRAAQTGFSRVYEKQAEVIATADADAAAVFAHGMTEAGVAVAPDSVELVAIHDAFYTSRWLVGVVDATNVNLVKGTGVGSGNAAAQVRIVARRPHSMVR